MNTTTTKEIVLNPTPAQIEEYMQEQLKMPGRTVIEENTVESKIHTLEYEVEHWSDLVYKFVTDTGQERQFADFLKQLIKKEQNTDWRERRFAIDELHHILNDYQSEGK